MSYFTSNKASLSVIMGVFFFSAILQINVKNVYDLLKLKGISIKEIDSIEIIEILAAITICYISTIIISFHSKKRIVATSLVIYLISLINLVVIENHKFVVMQLILMSVTKYLFFISGFLIFADCFKNNNIKAISGFFLSLGFGALIGETFATYIRYLNTANIQLLLCFILGLVIINIIIFSRSSEKIEEYPLSYARLLKMSELEILSGFVVLYVAFSIYWDHEVFALSRGINISDIADVMLYMICGMILFIYPTNVVMRNFSKFKLNLFCIFTLICEFIIFQNIGSKFIGNLVINILLGGNLYSILAINLSIIADKFEGVEFSYAITIFMTISLIGGYIGIIVTDSMIETYDINGFLISIYSALSSFLIYYILQFFTLRLYKS